MSGGAGTGSGSGTGTGTGDERDARDLAGMGYAQQLLRDMGGFSSFAVSFSIISILTGAVTLYKYGLRNGGPFEMTVGWPVVTLFTLPFALSLAELASAYPTAGALYHWSAILGGPGWGWFTAWTNTVGQFAITAGIDYGLAELLTGLLGLPGLANPLGIPPDRATVLAVYLCVLVSHGVLNHVGIHIVARLNDFSAIYHVAGAALIIAAALFLAPARDWGVLLRATSAEEGLYGYGFLVGLLQAQWTFTGYDASAHVSEETHDPRRNAPWGMFLSVAISGVVGYVMLLAVTSLIRDLPAAQAAQDPFRFILEDALGARLGTALVWVCVLAMWFCGLSSITSNSRMLFAFARDGGLPCSAAIAHVSPRFRTPAPAVWVSVAAAFALAVWSGAYSVITSISTLALYVSYALPILLAWDARRRGRLGPPGPWSLGRFSAGVNLAALLWTVALLVIFVLPPNELAGTTGLGVAGALGVYFLAGPRRTFRGPPAVSTAQAPATAVGR